MSTNRRKSDFAAEPLSMKELTEVLVKHYGLPKGAYDIGIEFQIGTGKVGPSNEELLPGIILGVKSVGLAQTKAADIDSAHASEDAPAAIEKKPRAKKPATA
jgi:hypothetical protein